MGLLAAWGLPAGDPAKIAKAMVDVVKNEVKAAGRDWTSRILLGLDSVRTARRKRQRDNRVTDEWEDISAGTNRDGAIVSEAIDQLMLMSGAD